MKKVRLDILLSERNMTESRTLAQRLVMAGQVRVSGQVVLKPSQMINPEDEIVIDAQPPFVSRGGEKLEAALMAFRLTDLSGFVCADVGASTGGFTDCMLQHHAERVYAIDVGYGILHWKLRNDPRVVSMEKTNARFVENLPEKIHLITIDASFISLKVLLPAVKNWLNSKTKVLALIKPQFEVGRAEAAKTEGVIRDPSLHRKVIKTVFGEANELGFYAEGLIRSPLLGPKGNTEFLVLWSLNEPVKRLENDMVQTLFGKENSID